MMKTACNKQKYSVYIFKKHLYNRLLLFWGTNCLFHNNRPTTLLYLCKIISKTQINKSTKILCISAGHLLQQKQVSEQDNTSEHGAQVLFTSISC